MEKVLLMRTSNCEKPIKRWKSVFCKPWKMFYFGAEWKVGGSQVTSQAQDDKILT